MRHAILAVVVALPAGMPAGGAAPPEFADVRPLLARYCLDCHAGEEAESDVDLATFTSLDDVRRQPKTWQRVARVLAAGDMPPPDSDQPPAAERERLAGWVRGYLASEAAARAGDPGPVVLRRLSNAEYTATVRDLTGVESLDPVREFPVDGAAGEGFQNTGQALVMSPMLVTKYLAAAKQVAAHALLLPDGIRFSAATDRGDRIDEALAKLRGFYARYTVAPTDPAGRPARRDGGLPIATYLQALSGERERLRAGGATIEQLAAARGLSPKYLGLLWRALEPAGSARPEPATLLDPLRATWAGARPAAVEDAAAQVLAWQQQLWRFNRAGHIDREYGGTSGPPSWLEPVTPLAERQEFEIPLAADGGRPVVVRLVAGDGGDGDVDDLVVWRRPRIALPGCPDLPARDARRLIERRTRRRDIVVEQAAACLDAIDAAIRAGKVPGEGEAAWEAIAARKGLDPLVLAAWGSGLGFSPAAAAAEPACGPLLTERTERFDGQAGVSGWTGPGDLSVVANSTAAFIDAPGRIAPGSVAVHPAASRQVVVAWRAPTSGSHRVDAAIQQAHVGCGTGVAWSVEWRRGGMRQVLAEGRLRHKPERGTFAAEAGLPLQAGDLICIVVSSPDGNQECDQTSVGLDVTSGDRRWSLGTDVAGDILAGNPQGDRQGGEAVWHFASEPNLPPAGLRIPAGSLLARWQLAAGADERHRLAADLQALLAGSAPPDGPDGVLHGQLLSPAGSLLAAATADEPPAERSDPRFGGLVGGCPVDPFDIGLRAPGSLDLELPAGLGGTFRVTAEIHPEAGPEATTQVTAVIVNDSTADRPGAALGPQAPFVARPDSPGWRRLERSFAEHRRLFPPAVCYERIVPADETVTLNLFYREDQRLVDLLLDAGEAAELDRLWDELRFVSDEPLEMLDAYEQLLEYATQVRSGAAPKWAALRPALEARAAAFRERKAAAEGRQLDAVVAFAERAFRRPLTEATDRSLRGLYADLRADELPPDEALRLLLARVLVSPDFLYKAETPPPGRQPAPLDDHELASRLSYFLWSSLPDAELLREAAAGRLRETDVLLSQTRRMVSDPKIRRLATEFGTYWLHVENFAAHDEKSPEAFPEFAALRGPMHEEAVLLLTDLFRNDRPIRSLLDADHTFLNARLAEFYGIPGVTGEEWRRVEDVRRHGRGGILALGATLAKQSGASRTSPILRGTWLTEVLLGERVPKPPKGVPPLAEAPPAGLSERELTALHSRDARCAGCHARFDPYGFALEGFDAIGRRRDLDAAGKPVDTSAILPDGTRITGHEALRDYLGQVRRAEFLRQFCKKLLGYALGRETQLSDGPLLDEIHARLEAGDGRVSAAVEAIVASRQFREIRGLDAVDAE